MKYFQTLFKSFLHKEKIFIILSIFILLNISLYVVFQQSIYCQDGYAQTYPHAGLQFFYYIHTIGINPYHFICLMLLVPNIVSADMLTNQIKHAHYPIETRICKKSYYLYCYLINFILTFVTVLMIEIAIVFIIHFFYIPIQFNQTVYPENYYAMTQLLFHNEIWNLVSFIILTSLGYAVVSSLLFCFQVFINNVYVYRCIGVLIGILLVLLPAIIQVYIPIQDAAFILQINNLVCLGIEGLRESTFFQIHWLIYLISFLIYGTISWTGFQLMYQWRYRND